ncbi:MAG: hypothetical protein MRY59_09330 [Aquisalinus sp.]|nr:hypothetical protein [Aquisalinus sp.]
MSNFNNFLILSQHGCVSSQAVSKDRIADPVKSPDALGKLNLHLLPSP